MKVLTLLLSVFVITSCSVCSNCPNKEELTMIKDSVKYDVNANHVINLKDNSFDLIK